jgi:hypothetical protein
VIVEWEPGDARSAKLRAMVLESRGRQCLGRGVVPQSATLLERICNTGVTGFETPTPDEMAIFDAPFDMK